MAAASCPASPRRPRPGFSFTTGRFSEDPADPALAQLDYLPLTWAQASGSAAPLTDAAAQYSAAYDPPQGNFTWQSGYPLRLMSFWKPDGPSEILRGAVAAFQADHGLIDDMIAENQHGLITSGSIGHRLWVDIFKSLAKDQLTSMATPTRSPASTRRRRSRSGTTAS